MNFQPIIALFTQLITSRSTGFEATTTVSAVVPFGRIVQRKVSVVATISFGGTRFWRATSTRQFCSAAKRFSICWSSAAWSMTPARGAGGAMLAAAVSTDFSRPRSWTSWGSIALGAAWGAVPTRPVS